jgi:hypothetical protein
VVHTDLFGGRDERVRAQLAAQEPEGLAEGRAAVLLIQLRPERGEQDVAARRFRGQHKVE